MKYGGGGEHGGSQRRESSAVELLFYLFIFARGGGVSRRTNSDVLPAELWGKVLRVGLRYSRRRRVRCNAVKTRLLKLGGGAAAAAAAAAVVVLVVLVGGREAGQRAPAGRTIPTRCRGSAAGSGRRAPSCRCRRAGRKPATTTAGCSSSTTTPGRRRGLTPEIGNVTPEAREQPARRFVIEQ